MALTETPGPSSFPEMYERCLVQPLFRPWAELIVKRMELTVNDRLLDIACGTGIVARLARQRTGPESYVVGVDINPRMLAVARALEPGVNWREGNAAALPVSAGEQFDVVVCHQGLQFFADQPGAVSEMRRVMAPAGRLAIATWRPLEEVPLLGEFHQVAERHLGPIVDRRHALGNAKELERMLVDAGLHDVKVEILSRAVRFSDAASFVRMNATALVGMSTVAAELDEAKRAEVTAAIASDSSTVLLPFMDGQDLAFEISANLAVATY
jgi:ubiquinone/menaquinone biosynthesis C-methylase UbiE